jgi:hypothetical protein
MQIGLPRERALVIRNRLRINSPARFTYLPVLLFKQTIYTNTALKQVPNGTLFKSLPSNDASCYCICLLDNESAP